MHKAARGTQVVPGYPRCPGVLYLHTCTWLTENGYKVTYFVLYNKLPKNLYMSLCHPETI